MSAVQTRKFRFKKGDTVLVIAGNDKGKTGTVNIRFESLAFPDNPKTSYLAAVSALAALKEFSGKVRYGT